MKQIAYPGMDVHKNSITLALFVGRAKTEEFTKKIENNISTFIPINSIHDTGSKLVKKLQKQYHLRGWWMWLYNLSKISRTGN